MISAFYRMHSRKIIFAVLATFPLALWLGERLPSNNDIETWLPAHSPSRATYERFQNTFGADEFVVVGYQRDRLETLEVEALCRRLERLDGVKNCWSHARLCELMAELEVDDADAQNRLSNLIQSKSGDYHSILLIFDSWGVANRSEVVGAVRHQLDYCDIPEEDIALSGAPVVVTELDRLGNRDNNKVFFGITLMICLALLQLTIRDWKMSLSVVGLTVWSIEVTLALLNLAGVEMNFILSALPVLVMVFTLAVSIHFLHSYRDHLASSDPLTDSIKAIWVPAVLATITTVIGLGSLAISSIGPVQVFGLSGATGSVVALIAGLGVLPAVVLELNYRPALDSHSIRIYRAGLGLVNNARPILLVTLAIVIACGFGLPRLSSRIDPIEFLPDGSEALTDIRTVEKNLTSYDTIEVMVDFGVSEATVFDRIEEVQRIQGIIEGHPAVGHTMSLVSFIPSDALTGTMPATSLIAQARGQHNHDSFVADAERMWRISARLVPNSRTQTAEVVAAIKSMTAGAPITITGLTTVLDTAQQDIFVGFWESFASAFFLISLVVLLALRSVKAGLLAMIPNLTPIAIVFGAMGWMDIQLDIGTMMTASIALGLAVDGTFHLLFAHRRIQQEIDDPIQCTHQALCTTGGPILLAAVISAIGMLALTLSNFKPTAKFGFLMFALLLTALIGDLVLLPAILAIKRKKAVSTKVVPDPHFQPANRPAVHV
ncbi:MAG: RND family transporter [Planctomycetaceae bacterium]